MSNSRNKKGKKGFIYEFYSLSRPATLVQDCTNRIQYVVQKIFRGKRHNKTILQLLKEGLNLNITYTFKLQILQHSLNQVKLQMNMVLSIYVSNKLPLNIIIIILAQYQSKIICSDKHQCVDKYVDHKSPKTLPCEFKLRGGVVNMSWCSGVKSLCLRHLSH